MQIRESDLEELRSAVGAFIGADKSAEALLRQKRRALAESLLTLDESETAARFGSDTAEAYRLLVTSPLRDVPRDSDDEALARRVRLALEYTPRLPAPLLAAMLLFHGFELPLPGSLDVLPDWVLPHYARSLLVMPQLFQAPGDAIRYHDFLVRAVDLIHGYVLREAPPPQAAAVRDIFVRDGNFTQFYFNDCNLKDTYRKRAQLLEHFGLANGVPLAHSFARRARDSRRLRVGILSLRLVPQTETYFILAQLERFPREHCTLILYALKDEPRTPLSEYARGLADAAVDLPPYPVDAARRIRADELDVLVVANNVTYAATDLSFLSLFRLARTQVILASSPVTTGFTNADWFLSAEENDSEERAATQYTEQVYRIPGMLSRYAYHLDQDPQTIRADRDYLGIPRDAILFMSGANYFKLIPELTATLARIMARVPGAWLLLMPFNLNWGGSYFSAPFTERILRQAAEAGANPGRVLIMPAVPTRADLHAVMALADVYLDSFPFAGACSLLDPLLVGTPVVARSGHSFRGDVGASMLRGLGLGDMAAASEEGYVERAVSLAHDPALRGRARERIKAALTPRNPVFDSETASGNFEAALRNIAARSQAAEDAVAQASPAVLRTAIERLAGALSRERNSWFASLNDIELGRQILLPYFGSLPEEPGARCLIDVGACVGQTSEPFLASGWKAELFEPDEACEHALRILLQRYGGRVRVHRQAVTESVDSSLPYFRSATGLSGLSPSPFGVTEATLWVPATRLDEFCRRQGLARVDLLKVDAEGWDFDVLRSHDFETRAPRLAMVEFGTEFSRQPIEAIRGAIDGMKQHGYEALVFSYEDDGNFKRQIWQYRLIGMRFGVPFARKDGHVGGNIVFFRRDDAVFLATALRTLLGFLPPRERARFLP